MGASPQQTTTGHVNWGLKGVAGAAIVGGVAAGATFGAGTFATSIGAGAVGSGIIGGAAGGAAGYAAGAGVGQHDFTVGGLAKSMFVGGVVGGAAAGVGELAQTYLSGTLGKVGAGIVGAMAGGAAGYAIASGIMGEKLTWEGLALAEGQGLASFAASLGTRALEAADAAEARAAAESRAENAPGQGGSISAQGEGAGPSKMAWCAAAGSGISCGDSMGRLQNQTASERQLDDAARAFAARRAPDDVFRFGPAPKTVLDATAEGNIEYGEIGSGRGKRCRSSWRGADAKRAIPSQGDHTGRVW